MVKKDAQLIGESEPVNVRLRLNRETHQQVAAAGKRTNMSKGAFIRMAIHQALEEETLSAPPVDWEPSKRIPKSEIRIDVYQEDIAAIAYAAEQVGVPLKTFILNAALHQKPPVPRIARDQADVIMKELQKQGHNLNQIAIRVNQDVMDADTRAGMASLQSSYGALVSAIIQLVSVE